MFENDTESGNVIRILFSDKVIRVFLYKSNKIIQTLVYKFASK